MGKQKPVIILLLAASLFLYRPISAQTQDAEKVVSHDQQSWYSVNSTLRFSDHWGMVADFHIRQEDFLGDNYFYFARIGAINWINGKYPIVVGYAHMWLSPTQGNSTTTNEDRIYQQWSATHTEGKINILHRIRTEQRWRDIVVNDKNTGNRTFNFRLRYLASFQLQVFKNEKLPIPVISDELLVQFGKDVALNTFDQNRLFLGFRLNLTKNSSFDIGYMNILQQSPNGVNYSNTDLFRFFFYYAPDMRKGKLQEPIPENNE